MKKVVSTEERPYDRDITGREITRRWDVLECGHSLPSQYVRGIARRTMAANAGGNYYEDRIERHCKTCEGATT